MRRIYSGSCHCGAVEFSVEADLDRATLLECNCSICRKKGFLHLIVPGDRFELEAGRERLREYRFNTRTAVHRFCEECGIHPFYSPRSHPEGVSVNARCLEEVDLASLEFEPFDGRNWQDAIEHLRE